MSSPLLTPAVPSLPPLPTNTPINFVYPNGAMLTVDNITGLVSLSGQDADGTSTSTMFIAQNPSNPSSTAPLSPGSSVILYSAATGAYCRVADLSTGRRRMLLDSSSCPTQSLVCDAPTAAGASILTWTGSGLSYQGIPYVQQPGGTTMGFTADPVCSMIGSSSTISVSPVPSGGHFSCP
jgi:hypothetical protein